MADSFVEQDSPLSITASIAGILTFIVAVIATIYVRITYLRNSDEEYFKVKASLSWYKTESTWMSELVRAAGEVDRPGFGLSGAQYRQTAEYQMYSFVMDDLVKLEQRLLDLVEETEVRAASSSGAEDEKWTFVPRSWGFTRTKTSVAMAWLPVRTKALELVRQRDALTARVLFTQTSMISSRIRDLEHRASWRQDKEEENMRRIEAMVANQQAELRRLEDLVRRNMHRNRMSELPAEQGGLHAAPEPLKPPREPLVQDFQAADTQTHGDCPQSLRPLSVSTARPLSP